MYVIRNTLGKQIALFSMVCYLMVSGIAAAHAFPLLLEDSVPQTSQAKATMNCHQLPSQEPGADMSQACKIFCAAIASVLPIEDSLELTASSQESLAAIVSPSLVSQLLKVEPAPPK